MVRRWYCTEKEAIEVARGRGCPCWKVQRTNRVRHGTIWCYERYLIGDPRWYCGFNPPKSVRRWRYERVA